MLFLKHSYFWLPTILSDVFVMDAEDIADMQPILTPDRKLALCVGGILLGVICAIIVFIDTYGTLITFGLLLFVTMMLCVFIEIHTMCQYCEPVGHSEDSVVSTHLNSYDETQSLPGNLDQIRVIPVRAAPAVPVRNANGKLMSNSVPNSTSNFLSSNSVANSLSSLSAIELV